MEAINRKNRYNSPFRRDDRKTRRTTGRKCLRCQRARISLERKKKNEFFRQGYFHFLTFKSYVERVNQIDGEAIRREEKRQKNGESDVASEI